MSERGLGLRGVYALYFFTGLTGLMAQGAIERALSVLLGATAHTGAVVLAASFAGFALGGWLAQGLLRLAPRTPRIQLYGVLEGLVGVMFLLVPLALSRWSGGIYEIQSGLIELGVGKVAIRTMLGAAMVLPISIPMGMSFPVLGASLDWTSGDSRLDRLYLMNLAGGLAGAVLGPHAVMPLGGLGLVFGACAAINLVVAGMALKACLVGRAVEIARNSITTNPAFDSEIRPKVDSTENGPNLVEMTDHSIPVAVERDAVRVLLSGAFLSGFIYFAMEVLWIHLGSVVIGGSMYAYASMLMVVMAGLLLGAWLQRRPRFQRMPLHVLTVLGGFTVVAQVFLWPGIPEMFLLVPWLKSFWAGEVWRTLAFMLVALPSATVLGMIFPRLLVTASSNPGLREQVGRISAANSLGCLLGALAASLLLIPYLGSEWSLRVLGVVTLGLGYAYLDLVHRKGEENEPDLAKPVVFRRAAGFLTAVLCLWLPWSRNSISSGNCVYFGYTYTNPSDQKSRILFWDEDAFGGITTVVQNAHPNGHDWAQVLLTNGKFQGITASAPDESEEEAQRSFAVLPTALAKGRGRALCVGAGTGQSAWALTKFFPKVDVVDNAPGILKAARTHFKMVNADVLDSPNVEVIVDDGRSLLATSKRHYDVIQVEISSVWLAGATSLYAREFYTLAKQRLAVGGVIQQWVQLHHISSREIGSIVASMKSVFPYVSLWEFGGQGMLVAADHPVDRLDPKAWRDLVVEIKPSAALTRHWDPQSHRLLGDSASGQLAARSVVNTDWNRYLERMTPRYNLSKTDWFKENTRVFKGMDSVQAMLGMPAFGLAPDAGEEP